MQAYTPFHQNRLTIRGIAAAALLAGSPFMYGMLFGRGIFLYLAFFFVFALLIYALVKNSGRISFQVMTTEKLFCACMLWQILTYLWSPAKSGDSLYAMVKIIVLFLLLSTCRYSGKEKQLMLWSTVVVAVFAIYSVLTSNKVFSTEGVDAMRVSFSFFGVMQDPNYLCFFFLMPVAFLISGAMDSDGSVMKRLLCGGILLYLLYGIMRTGSRGGLIGAVTAIAVYLCTFQKQKWKTILVIVVMTVMVVLAYDWFISLLPTEIANRFTIDNVLSNGGSNRFSTWENYLSFVFSDPFFVLFGYGNGGGSYHFGYAAHNYLIETWFEYGLTGIILLGFFYWSILKQARKNGNWVAYSAMWGTLALAMTLSVGKILYFWLAVIFANMMSKERQVGGNAYANP